MNTFDNYFFTDILDNKHIQNITPNGINFNKMDNDLIKATKTACYIVYMLLIK